MGSSMPKDEEGNYPDSQTFTEGTSPRTQDLSEDAEKETGDEGTAYRTGVLGAIRRLRDT